MNEGMHLKKPKIEQLSILNRNHFQQIKKKRLFFICHVLHLSYMPATVLFNLASPCNMLTCFNPILLNYSALKQKSSLCHNDPNTHKPPTLFPTMHQVMGLLCQNHQSSTLSIFPLTDTVTLSICMPVLTVISLGWIV